MGWFLGCAGQVPGQIFGELTCEFPGKLGWHGIWYGHAFGAGHPVTDLTEHQGQGHIKGTADGRQQF